MNRDGIPLPHLVVFCDPEPIPPNIQLGWRERLVWWALHAFLRPGFRHCMVLQPFTLGQSGGWLHVNPLSNGIDISICPARAAEAVLEQVRQGKGFAVWTHPVRETRVLGGDLLTCVSVVKAVLGLRCRALTPYGLYRHLKRQEDVTMGGFFSKPSAPAQQDTSYLEKQLELQKEQKDQLERENAARRRNLRARSSGGPSLRFSGVPDVSYQKMSDTLGG